MTRTGVILAAVFSLGIAGPALAQTERIQREVDEKLRQRRLYEDAEIMRRLLNRALLHAYGFHGPTEAAHAGQGAGEGMVGPVDSATHRALAFLRAAGHGLAPGTSPHHTVEAEGTYLKGRGVVYSVTLPRPMHDPRPEAAKPVATGLSDWDRLRRELRGEKVGGGNGPPARKDPRIADVVLKVLADNGRHFAHLAADEQLTVAITFRGQACTACHAPDGARGGISPFGAGAGGGGEMGVPLPFGTPSVPGEGGVPPPGGAPSGPVFPRRGSPGGPDPELGVGGGGRSLGPPAGGLTGPDGGLGTGLRGIGPGIGMVGGQPPRSPLDGLRAGLTNHVLLGDLHARQGRHREAVKAYEDALDQYQEMHRGLDRWGIAGPERLQIYLAGSELYGKLAQSYLGIGDLKKAMAATEQHAEAAVEAMQQADAGKAPSGQPPSKRPRTGSIPLAPKLMISAPKKLLDQVGAGKMTFEEFKKAATVEYLALDAPADSGATPDGPGAGAGAGKGDADEKVTLQYRVKTDAVAPSQFIAFHDGGASPFLKITWDIPGDQKEELDTLLRELERKQINGVEFVCRGQWLKRGALLRVTTMPQLTENGKKRMKGDSGGEPEPPKHAPPAKPGEDPTGFSG